MPEPIDNLYFNWLCAKVTYVENPTPSNTYTKLLKALFQTEYIWLVSGDDNRAEDGVELRDEFIAQTGFEVEPAWMEVPCSLLEMFIAFSRRAEFMTDISALDWFWEFMTNLGLDGCTDSAMCSSDDVGEVLFNFIWRQYDLNGRGGIFPMQDPPEDQTNVEIWYQFCEYLVDQNRMP